MASKDDFEDILANHPRHKSRKRKSDISNNIVKPLMTLIKEEVGASDVKNHKAEVKNQNNSFENKSDAGGINNKKLANNQGKIQKDQFTKEEKSKKRKFEGQNLIRQNLGTVSKHQKKNEKFSKMEESQAINQLKKVGKSELKNNISTATIDPDSIVIDQQDLIVKSKLPAQPNQNTPELQQKKPLSIDPDSIVIDNQDLVAKSAKPAKKESKLLPSNDTLQTIHKKVKMFRCLQCSTHFSSKQDLSNHFSAVHESKSNFSHKENIDPGYNTMDKNVKSQLKAKLKNNKSVKNDAKARSETTVRSIDTDLKGPIATSVKTAEPVLENTTDTSNDDFDPELFAMDDDGQFVLKSELNKKKLEVRDFSKGSPTNADDKTNVNAKGPIKNITASTDMPKIETDMYAMDDSGQFVLKSELKKNQLETKIEKPKGIDTSDFDPDLYAMNEDGQFVLKSELNKSKLKAKNYSKDESQNVASSDFDTDLYAMDEDGQFVLKSELNKKQLEAKDSLNNDSKKTNNSDLDTDLYAMDEDGQFVLKSELNKKKF